MSKHYSYKYENVEAKHAFLQFKQASWLNIDHSHIDFGFRWRLWRFKMCHTTDQPSCINFDIIMIRWGKKIHYFYGVKNGFHIVTPTYQPPITIQYPFFWHPGFTLRKKLYKIYCWSLFLIFHFCNGDWGAIIIIE